MMRHLFAAATIALATCATARAQETPVAFTGATLIVIDGPDMANGTIVLHEGKIAAVGAADAVTLPEGATVIDAAGKIIMPGLVDTHSHIGGPGGGDSSGPLHPDVRVMDSINPLSPGFRRAAAGGVTTMRLEWSPHEATAAEIACFAGAVESLGQGWGAGMELLTIVLAEMQASA